MIYYLQTLHLARIIPIILLFVSALHAQTLEAATDSAATADTVRLDSATETQSPAEAGRPVRPFSLFDYGEIIPFGLSLDYLYYHEDISDDIGNFPVYGVPKSTEYGFLIGLRGGATFYSLENKLFLRPRAAVLLGFGNTYDGSLQRQPILGPAGDTAGFEYTPYKFTKNNFFLHAGCDLGYSFPHFNFPFALYTGLDFKLWYRDLMESQDVLYYTPGVANSETYYWLGVPLGVLITRPVSTKLLLGMDACATVMFTGGMNVAMTAADGSPLNYPAVTLGNRTSLKVELFMQRKLDERLSVKFAPYFLWYNFGKSNSEPSPGGNGASFFEPSSTSYLMGFILTWEVLSKRFY